MAMRMVWLRAAFGLALLTTGQFGKSARSEEQATGGLVKPAPPKAAPALQPIGGAEFVLHGALWERIQANAENWLLRAPRANPAMLQMFRDRDRTPRRDLVPWAGEFAGKYLISGVQALRLTHDDKLKSYLLKFVDELIATQDEDGYLGPFPKDQRMVGGGLWDLWGQYHVMLGLLLWADETDDPEALLCCRRAADYFCQYFGEGGKRVRDAGSEEMNESSIHIFTLLYERTGEPRYLEMARQIEQDWQTPPSGDYVRAALAGKAFHQTAKPRWESLHGLQAIAELYFISGDRQYRQAYEQLWWSIVEGDRHATGGFSAGEQATGNPYDPRAIETCCTVAWMAMTVDYLRMSGDSRAADELELSLWNGILGAQNADGRWWTYNTPPDGERKASAHEIVFQARAGSPELNCCSVNGPRGIGMLADWAVMSDPQGIAINYYGPAVFRVKTQAAGEVRLAQKTHYPRTGAIRLEVSPAEAKQFTLKLRIPGWSRKTAVRVNGEMQPNVQPGTYLALDRAWKAGDVVELELDCSPRLWVGEREAAGKMAIYQGPLLLAYDPRFDRHDPRQLPVVVPKQLAAADASSAPAQENSGHQARRPSPEALLTTSFATADGGQITLCDFASAGAAGNVYVSWLPAPAIKPAPFSRDNPMRIVWPD